MPGRLTNKRQAGISRTLGTSLRVNELFDSSDDSDEYDAMNPKRRNARLHCLNTGAPSLQGCRPITWEALSNASLALLMQPK